MYFTFFTRLILLNVIRDWRKNLIACVAILVGTVSLILFGGYVAQMYEGIRLGSIYSQLGHYQIQAQTKGEEAYSKSYISAEMAADMTQQLESLSEVYLVTPRVEAQGLISFGDSSVGVLAYGVNADEDAEISTSVSIVEGTGLFTERHEGALVGKELLEELGASLGDVLTLLTTTSDGAINAIDIEVTGIMDTGAKELNKRFVKVNLSLMQEALYSTDVTNLVVLMDEAKANANSDHKIRELVAKNDQLKIQSWSDMSDSYHQIVTMFNNIFGFVTALVIIIIFAAIFNTMTMGVMERVAELSTIRALGSSRSGILAMVMVEGLVVGVIAIAVGVLCGMLISYALNFANIIMPKPPGSTFEYPLRILVNLEVVLWPAILTLIATIFGCMFPAYKAGQLPINEAMQR